MNFLSERLNLSFNYKNMKTIKINELIEEFEK